MKEKKVLFHIFGFYFFKSLRILLVNYFGRIYIVRIEYENETAEFGQRFLL